LSRRLNSRLDADDIVQCVYISFFCHVRAGRYEFRTSGDVWRLLAVMTIRLINRQVQWHTVRKRSVYFEQNTTVLNAGREWPPDRITLAFAPDVIVALKDELSCLFAARPVHYRVIVHLRLNGEPIGAIARTVPCCQRTVHRVLARFKQELAERLAT
jgi:DNA-directed RNA polymerase specialized sigma24 family protein